MVLNQNKNLPKVLSVYKPAGLTPLQSLNLLRERFPEYCEANLSYAGRLDPLAEGVMLVLVGEGNNEREKYLGLPKVYEAEILFGISTDTGDVLGLITNSNPSFVLVDDQTLKNVLVECVGTFRQDYPKFSSPKISGKTNFSKEVEISSIELLQIQSVDSKKLTSNIQERITKVVGDFRQTEILTGWDKFFANNPDIALVIATIKVKTGSGVYIRLLAERVGAKLGVPALAYSIKRTQVGDYSIDTALKLE